MPGSMTHRPDGRYDRYQNHQDNDYEYATSGTAEKDYKKPVAIQQHFKEDN